MQNFKSKLTGKYGMSYGNRDNERIDIIKKENKEEK